MSIAFLKYLPTENKGHETILQLALVQGLTTSGGSANLQ